MKFMNHIFISFTATVLMSFTALSQTTSNFKDFNKKANELGLKFHMPSNFKEIKTNSNKQLHYIFAIKNDKTDFEIRYSLYAVKEKDKKRYKECQNNPKCSSINPNNMFKSHMMANTLNMTGGKVSRVDTVKSPEKFAADKVVVLILILTVNLVKAINMDEYYRSRRMMLDMQSSFLWGILKRKWVKI